MLWSKISATFVALIGAERITDVAPFQHFGIKIE